MNLMATTYQKSIIDTHKKGQAMNHKGREQNKWH